MAAGCAGQFQWSASTGSKTSSGGGSTAGGQGATGAAITEDEAAYKTGGSYAVQKNVVLRTRTQADAEPDNPEKVDAFASAVMGVYNTNQHESDNSVDWGEHARRAIELAKGVAAKVTPAERKAHFHLLRAVLLKHQGKTSDSLAAFDQGLQAQPQNLELVGWKLEIWSEQKAGPGEGEKLCKRTRRAMTDTMKIYDLISLCAQWHPKRESVDPVLDLAVLVPWVAPAELKQYKRWLGENQCGGEKLKECTSRCQCDPAAVRCRCVEQCKSDRNSCLVPYLS